MVKITKNYTKRVQRKSYAATVVIMTYNQVTVVRDAIESILNQTCESLEIIISDDASSDGTWKEINNTVAAYTGHHLVRISKNSVNLGLIPHYNKCFKMAQSDIIIICGGDDISDPLRAQKLIKEFRTTNALLVFSDIDKYSLNEKRLADNFLRSPPTFYSNYSLWDAAKSFSLYVGGAAAYHKDIFKKYGYIEQSDVYEDVILGFRAALEGRVSMIPEQLVAYRLGGLSTNAKDKIARCTGNDHSIKILKKSINVIKQRLTDIRSANRRHASIKLLLIILLFKQRFKFWKALIRQYFFRNFPKNVQ